MQYKRQLAGIQSIFLTLMLLIGAMIGFGVFIDLENNTLFSLEFSDPIILSVIGLFAVCFPLSNRLFNAHMQREHYTAHGLFGRYISGVTIRAATLSAPGIFAAVVYLFSRNMLAGIIGTMCFLLILKDFPVRRLILNKLGLKESDLRDIDEISEN